jgi:hypothetical protein
MNLRLFLKQCIYYKKLVRRSTFSLHAAPISNSKTLEKRFYFQPPCIPSALQRAAAEQATVQRFCQRCKCSLLKSINEILTFPSTTINLVAGTALPTAKSTASHGTARHGTGNETTARHGTANHGTARHGKLDHPPPGAIHTSGFNSTIRVRLLRDICVVDDGLSWLVVSSSYRERERRHGRKKRRL